MQAANMDLNLVNTAATSVVGRTSQFMEDDIYTDVMQKHQEQQRAGTHDLSDNNNDVVNGLFDDDDDYDDDDDAATTSLTNGGDYDKDRIERDLDESRRELPEQYDNFHADNVETDHMLDYQTEAETETLNLLLPELQETNALDCSNFSMDVDDFNSCLNNMFCNDVDEIIPDASLVNVPLGQTKKTIAKTLPIVVDNGFNRNTTNSTERAIPITLQNIPDTKNILTNNNVIGDAYLEDIGEFCAGASNSNDSSNSMSDDSSRHSSKSSISSHSSSSISSCGNYNRATFTVAATTTSTVAASTSSNNIVTRNDAHHNGAESKHNVFNIFQ